MNHKDRCIYWELPCILGRPNQLSGPHAIIGASIWEPLICCIYHLGGGFKCFEKFTFTWGNSSNLTIICFKWVETTTTTGYLGLVCIQFPWLKKKGLSKFLPWGASYGSAFLNECAIGVQDQCRDQGLKFGGFSWMSLGRDDENFKKWVPNSPPQSEGCCCLGFGECFPCLTS